MKMKSNPGFVDRPRRSDGTAGQMDGEAGLWKWGKQQEEFQPYRKTDYKPIIYIMVYVNGI